MKIGPATLNGASKVVKWRNSSRETLRTCGLADLEQQEKFLMDLSTSKHRYFYFYPDKTKVIATHPDILAFGGLTYIQWENRLAEISLIVNPDNRKDGVGSDCVDMLLDEAFNKMNLKTVCGECYKCNHAWQFWYRVVEKYKGTKAILPNRKYWNGQYYDSIYFSIDVSGVKT